MLSPPLPPSPGAVVARAAARVGEDARAVLIEEVLLPLSASDEAALVDLEAHVPPGDRLLASARWVVMRRATDRRGALGALLEWTLGADAMADARAREADAAREDQREREAARDRARPPGAAREHLALAHVGDIRQAGRRRRDGAVPHHVDTKRVAKCEWYPRKHAKFGADLWSGRVPGLGSFGPKDRG